MTSNTIFILEPGEISFFIILESRDNLLYSLKF